MSVLPNASNANPTTYYWAEAGQGAATTIQSPVVVLPDGATDASLSVNAGSAAGDANLSVVAGASGIGTIELGGGGSVYTISANEAPIPAGLQISVAPTVAGQTPVFTYRPLTGEVVLGDSLPGGQVQIDNKLLVSAAPFNGNAVQITSASATTGNISNTVASGGGLTIGSSAATPSVLAIGDTAGAGSQFVAVGRGGATNLILQGGSTALNVPIVTTSASGAGTLCLGGSATNFQTMFVTDPTGVANSGYVDITGGTSTGTAVRLRGYGTGTSATVSTNNAVGVLNVSSGPTDSSPAIVISPTALTLNRNQTVFAAPTVGSGAYGITQQIINSGNDIGTTPFALTNPTLAGVYTILVRVGTAAAININGQISSVGYWDGTVWVAGAVNISPPLGTGNLYIWFGNTATTRGTLFIQNTGSAQISGVAVYMIPQMFGLSSVIT